MTQLLALLEGAGAAVCFYATFFLGCWLVYSERLYMRLLGWLFLLAPFFTMGAWVVAQRLSR